MLIYDFGIFWASMVYGRYYELVPGGYFMVYRPTNITGGAHPDHPVWWSMMIYLFWGWEFCSHPPLSLKNSTSSSPVAAFNVQAQADQLPVKLWWERSKLKPQTTEYSPLKKKKTWEWPKKLRRTCENVKQPTLKGIKATTVGNIMGYLLG